VKLRVPGQEVDKENLERDCGKRLSGAWIEQGGCHGLYLMDEADKGRLMTTIGVSG